MKKPVAIRVEIGEEIWQKMPPGYNSIDWWVTIISDKIADFKGTFEFLGFYFLFEKKE